MKSFGDWFNDLAGSIEDASEVKKEPQLHPKDDLYNAAIAASLSSQSPSNRLAPPQHVLDKLPAGAKILGVYEGVALGAPSPIWVGIDNKGFCITILGDDEDDIWTTHSPNQKTEEQIVADIKNVADKIGTIWYDYTPDYVVSMFRMQETDICTDPDTLLTSTLPDRRSFTIDFTNKTNQSPEEMVKASVTPLQIRAMYADLNTPDWTIAPKMWVKWFRGSQSFNNDIGRDLVERWIKADTHEREVEFVSKLRDDIYNGRI